jgi:hypothetical protein
MTRSIMLSALALVFVGVGCAQTPQMQPTAMGQPTPSNDAEGVNRVEGNFKVPDFFTQGKQPETVFLTQAYAHRVKNEKDQSKQDILILLTEKPVARKVLAEADDDKQSGSSRLHSKLTRKGVRGIQLRFAAEKKAAFGKENQEAESAAENDFDIKIYYSNGSIETSPLKFTPAVFTADAVHGSITATGDWADKFNISFKVSLRPQGWTGGVFYLLPPTNIEPGRASGQIVIERKATKLNYVYARQQGHDLFDEKDNRVKLVFTEKPVIEDARDGEIEYFLRMKRAGNTYVMVCDLTANNQSNLPHILDVTKFSESKTSYTMAETMDIRDALFGTDIDLSKFDGHMIDGRIYTSGPDKRFHHTYELEVSFNAPINKPDATDAPVTAGNGQPIPVGGGGPGQAFLAFITAVPTTKNFKELTQLMEASQSVRTLADMKRSLATVSAEKEQETFELMKAVMTIANPRVEGGFISGDKATLWITGTDDGKKATARVNMHLEKHQWKVGMVSKRGE